MIARFVLALALGAGLAAAAAAQPAPSSATTAASVTASVAASVPASVPAEVRAAPAAPAATAPRPAPVAIGMAPAPGLAAGNLLQTIFALCLVLGLLAGFAWFIKRYGPKASGGSAHLRIVGALNLGGRERIMVVEVGEQWIVVGAAPGRVNALATMARQPGAEPNAALHPPQNPASSFSEWLKQTIDKRNAK